MEFPQSHTQLRGWGIPRAPKYFGVMNGYDRRETECGKCVASVRCWQERLPIDSGLLVRRPRPLEAGEFLFHQGEAFEAPYIVTSGCIALPEVLPNGAERIAGFLVSGEIIGLESWAGGTHLHGAQAVNAATVCRLKWSSRGLTLALMKPLLAKLAGQLDRATRPWAGLSAAERVAAFVEDFEQRAGMAPPMTRAQIGLHLGLAEETVVRALARSRKRSASTAIPSSTAPGHGCAHSKLVASATFPLPLYFRKAG